jgi:alkanesulfonate monooxygenase SsuD/methylene tetrahydromethanopterin reductase-like flavin-dependent oxidoreductase (luciferase family)
MTVLGAIFLPALPPERLRAIARAADEAGLSELWLWEDCFRESGIAAAAAVLAWTERLRVGVGLLPVPLRNVALTAMELATMHRLFPDRLSVAVGHGVQGWMEQVGARVESPMTLLREYVDALRALLRGETVTVSGRYVRLDRVALDWPPLATLAEPATAGVRQPSAPAVLAGAVGPRSLRLSGEVADGTVLVSGTTTDGVRRARALIDEGRATGQVTGGHRVVLFAFAATGPDAEQRLARSRERWGLDPDADLGVAGDAETVAAAVRRWAAAGADTVVLEPTDDDPDPEGFVRFVGAEVRPLIEE